MGTAQTAPLEPGNRVQIPADRAEALGLRGVVTLERTDEGILIRAAPRYTWDEIFATRLSARPGDPAIPPRSRSCTQEATATAPERGRTEPEAAAGGDLLGRLMAPLRFGNWPTVHSEAGAHRLAATLIQPVAPVDCPAPRL